jgi:hypothetical protein
VSRAASRAGVAILLLAVLALLAALYVQAHKVEYTTGYVSGAPLYQALYQ